MCDRLLNLQRAEIEAALRTAKLPWREDATNQGGDFFRNRIRNVVLPAWIKASERDAIAGAALSRKLIEEDDTALEELAERLYSKMPPGKLRLSGLDDVAMAGIAPRLVSLAPSATEGGGAIPAGF